ncbi:MAG: acetate--CoA ligase family protein [Nanoarchaeota archaeon]|nr:acetate--CoA ligase family protein [Nanoarchaeota archaeon]
MKVLSERYAEDFLEKEGFKVVEREFCSSKRRLKSSLIKIGYPFVLKATGKNLISKDGLYGVRLDIKTYTQALIEFENLKKIKGSNGVIVQKKIQGKEFFVNLRRVDNGISVFSLGFFSSNKNGEKEAFFKSFPAVKGKFGKIFKKEGKLLNISEREKKSLEEFLENLLYLLKRDKKIQEVVIDLGFIDGKNVTVANSRVVFS